MPAARKNMAFMVWSFVILPVRKHDAPKTVPTATPRNTAEGYPCHITIISTTPQQAIIDKKSL